MRHLAVANPGFPGQYHFHCWFYNPTTSGTRTARLTRPSYLRWVALRHPTASKWQVRYVVDVVDAGPIAQISAVQSLPYQADGTSAPASWPTYYLLAIDREQLSNYLGLR